MEISLSILSTKSWEEERSSSEEETDSYGQLVTIFANSQKQFMEAYTESQQKGVDPHQYKKLLENAQESYNKLKEVTVQIPLDGSHTEFEQVEEKMKSQLGMMYYKQPQGISKFTTHDKKNIEILSNPPKNDIIEKTIDGKLVKFYMPKAAPFSMLSLIEDYRKEGEYASSGIIRDTVVQEKSCTILYLKKKEDQQRYEYNLYKTPFHKNYEAPITLQQDTSEHGIFERLFDFTVKKIEQQSISRAPTSLQMEDKCMQERIQKQQEILIKIVQGLEAQKQAWNIASIEMVSTDQLMKDFGYSLDRAVLSDSVILYHKQVESEQ